jgi:tripartite-type tricarboxylate transporter receptor subunit TctC
VSEAATTGIETLAYTLALDDAVPVGGRRGAAQAARAVPDGYTILMALSSISVLPVADRLQGRPAAYELDQFAPIALISADPTVLVVRADGPYKTLKDLVDVAKAKPGAINYGSSGVYGTLHVAMEIFAAAADIKLFHIPYQGGGPAVAALLGPDRCAGLRSSAAIGQIKAARCARSPCGATSGSPRCPTCPA